MPIPTDHLILEGRISDFKKKYAYKLAPATVNYIIANDPSKNQKYLDWIGKSLVAADEDEDYISPEEMMKDIALFHKNIKGVDIYSLKSFDQLQSLVHKQTEPSSRQKILQGADIIVNDKNWLVVAPKTHDASMFFGGGTRWCISTSSESHWDKHYNEDGEAIIMLKNRKKTSSSVDWKLCLTVEPGESDLDHAYMYDVKDYGTSVRNSSFYSYVPEYVVDKINDYLYSNHDGADRRDVYTQEKEEKEIEEYMQREVIDDILAKYIRLIRVKYPKYAEKFSPGDLLEFLDEFVGEEIVKQMCQHIASSAIGEYGWQDMYIRSLQDFDEFLYRDSPNNANFFNYGLVSYVNKILGVDTLLNVIENSIGTATFDRLDADYEITNALNDCVEKYALAINQANQLQLPNFPQTKEKFKKYDIDAIIELLIKYGYDQLANIIKSYSVRKLQEMQYKQFIVFMV